MLVWLPVMIENEDAVQKVDSQHAQRHERKHRRTPLPNGECRGCGFTDTESHALPGFPLIGWGFSGLAVLATFGRGTRRPQSWFLGGQCLTMSHLIAFCAGHNRDEGGGKGWTIEFSPRRCSKTEIITPKTAIKVFRPSLRALRLRLRLRLRRPGGQ